MITPKWVKTKSQPIAIRNVIEFLTGVLLHPKCIGKAFDIGGLSILTYKEMLYGYAKNRGLKKLIITLPIMTPRLSSYWLYFVTSTSYPLAVNLVKSMKSEVLVKGDRLHEILNVKLYTYDEAMDRAIKFGERFFPANRVFKQTLVGIGLGGTAISIPMSIVGKHFPLSNRTIAMSFVTAVGSFGYFLSPLFTNYSLQAYGWNYTLFIFFILLIVGLIIAFFVRSPSITESIEQTSQQTAKEALSEAFSNKSYMLLVFGFFVCGFHITLVGTHVPKYVIDRGLESWTAAAILSLIGLFNIFGSLLSGYLSAKMSKKIILSAIYFLRGLSIIFFIFLPASVTTAFIFGASFGFLWLSTVPATSGIVAHLFGTKHLGLLYGIVFLSHQIGSFFGAYLGGLFHDLYGSYDYAWYLAIALSVFAGLIHLPIKEQPVERLQKA